MQKKDKHFTRLLSISKETALLQSTLLMLEWDQETYMPPGSIDSRSDQIELLSELIHKNKTSKKFQKALEKVVDLSTGKVLVDASPQMCAAIREWRREFLQSHKLPASFIKKFAKTTSNALHIFPQAKKTGDFPLFQPHMEKIVALSQQKAQLLGYKDHPYDALLDLYEPGLTVATLSPLFTRLKSDLRDLLKKIQRQPTPPPLTFPSPFSADTQLEAGHLILEAMGFSPQTSRLDISSHPFCTGIHPTDTRMTTRLHANSPLSNLFSVLHEGGHGLYNQNLPSHLFGTPVCDHASFGVDESQSRFWETIVGKSLPFWEFFYPKLQALFPENLSQVSLSDFYREINRVEPSLIRVEADEVTYCLHVILRFEIEKGLMDGSIAVKDIPELWNTKMEESLCLTPSHNGEGCLQDIHWAMGGIGYFPSYILGNLLAAEIRQALNKEHPFWQQNVKTGDFSSIHSWLKTHVHEKGKLYPSEELITQITGKSLSSDAYIQYLGEKYTTKP